MECIFCSALQKQEFLVLETEYWWVRLNPYPVTEGHLLMIPKRHQPHSETLNDAEKLEYWRVREAALEYLWDVYGVREYNLVENAGVNAGQTVFHLHVHLIPRRKGDVEGDPRGGATKFMKPLVEY